VLPSSENNVRPSWKRKRSPSESGHLLHVDTIQYREETSPGQKDSSHKSGLPCTKKANSRKQSPGTTNSLTPSSHRKDKDHDYHFESVGQHMLRHAAGRIKQWLSHAL
jgi:hypothetical protein